jgi:SulP family sulfate permease
VHFVIVVYGIIEKYGINGLTVAMLMGGIIIIIMGLTRLGSLLKFVPLPLIKRADVIIGAGDSK